MPQNQPPQVRQSEKLYKIKPPRTQARDNSQADITKSTTPVSKYSLYKIIGTLLTWLSTITKSTTPRPQTRYKISIVKPGLKKTNDFVMIQRRDIIETIRYDTNRYDTIRLTALTVYPFMFLQLNPLQNQTSMLYSRSIDYRIDGP